MRGDDRVDALPCHAEHPSNLSHADKIESHPMTLGTGYDITVEQEPLLPIDSITCYC